MPSAEYSGVPEGQDSRPHDGCPVKLVLLGEAVCKHLGLRSTGGQDSAPGCDQFCDLEYWRPGFGAHLKTNSYVFSELDYD